MVNQTRLYERDITKSEYIIGAVLIRHYNIFNGMIEFSIVKEHIKCSFFCKEVNMKKKNKKENINFCMKYLCKNCPHRDKCKL